MVVLGSNGILHYEYDGLNYNEIAHLCVMGNTFDHLIPETNCWD